MPDSIDKVLEEKQAANESESSKSFLEITEKEDSLAIVSRSKTIRTVEELLKEANVNTEVWEVESKTVRKWDVGSKYRDQNLTWRNGVMDGHAVRKNKWVVQELWAISVKLRRKTPERRALESLVLELREPGLSRVQVEYIATEGAPRRMLEIDLVDVHLGLQCFRPSSDHDYNLEIAEQLFRWSIDELLEKASVYAPFEYVLFPVGNDLLHVDNLEHSTTRGTNQPDAMSAQMVYKVAAKLLINVIETKLLPIAPVIIKIVPGNHDRFSAYTMGVVLWGRFGEHPNIEIDDSPSPYKFCSYGVNLLALEHGHSIKPVRMGSLMANECPEEWAKSRYREWHCGDQHRPGSAKMVTFSEQNVVIEYLTGLTPANEWHKTKSFNWQPRGANAFVWNYHTGKEARLFTHIDSYTGRLMR